jgi:hypothetical protein
MHLLTALDELLRLEIALGELYRWLSEIFGESDPDAAAVFFRLSLQEESHANLIRYHRRLVRRSTEISSEVVDFDTIIRTAVERVMTFKNSTGRPTLAEAAQVAAELESLAADSIHAKLAAHSPAELGGFIGSLLRDDRRHLEMVEALRERALRSTAA